MATITVLCTLAGLLGTAASLSLPPRSDSDDGVPLLKLKHDFGNGNASASWAAGYPKKWGSEDFHVQFNVPEPDDLFSAIVTEDEKYLALYNGSHAKFIELDTNSTVSTFSLGFPEGYFTGGLGIRSNPKGGYDAFTAANKVRPGWNTDTILRRRISSDLKPVGDTISYAGGDIGDFDKKGRMAVMGGQIYDLNKDTPDDGKITLKNNGSRITFMSFSNDSQYLSSVGWEDKSADLWNATTGEKILQFPATNAQNWVTKISPDNKYVLLSLGTGYIQIYSIANLTAAPKVLPKFEDWIRNIEWSPDARYLATADPGRIQVWKFPEAELVQTWEVDAVPSPGGVLAPSGLAWLDGRNKVTFSFRDGRYMYDFEQNLKYWWTPGFEDHSWGGNTVYFLKKRGYVVIGDGDSTARFWKI